MTDKAAVEVPAPVSGRVVSITGGPGDKVAVGSPLIVFDVGGDAAAHAPPHAPPHAPSLANAKAPAVPAAAGPAVATGADAASAPAARPGRVMTSPTNRRRAREAGIDLSTVVGSGPGGRILREDLAAGHPA